MPIIHCELIPIFAITLSRKVLFWDLQACKLHGLHPSLSQEMYFCYLLYFLENYHEVLTVTEQIFRPAMIGNSSSIPAYSSQLSFPSRSSVQFFPWSNSKMRKYLLVGDNGFRCYFGLLCESSCNKEPKYPPITHK